MSNGTLSMDAFIDWIRSHTVTSHSGQDVFLSDDEIGNGAFIEADDGSVVTFEISYEGGCESDPGGGSYVLRLQLSQNESG